MQEVYRVGSRVKADALVQLLKTKGPGASAMQQVIVFVNKKETCRRLARMLKNYGVEADAIHGDKTQDERQAALSAFRDGTVHVLVATDVAARGLDIKELPFVINFDVPGNPEDYVHRIGRTGRAGLKGLAMMITTEDDVKAVEAIEKFTNQKFKVIDMSPQRPRRSDRFERRRGGDDRIDTPEDEKAARELARSYVPPAQRFYDPIFSHPYFPSRKGRKADEVLTPFRPQVRRARPVAVLLGGAGK